MPQIDNSRGGVSRARRAKPKKRAYSPPPSRSDAAQRTGARTPAPKPRAVNPGTERPYTDRERRRVERYKRTPGYQRKLGQTRRERTPTTRSSLGHEVRAERDLRRALDYVRREYEREFGGKGEALRKLVHPSGRSTVLPDRALEVAQRRPERQRGAIDAAAIKVLEQTTRPVHAVAGTTNELLKGERVDRALGEGAKAFYTERQKTLFSDVLKTAGAPKVVQSVGGFGLDVALDPLTYVTFGTGSLARKAAMQAGASAAEKAAARGLSAEQVKRFGERAAKQAAAKAEGKGRGVAVRAAGREVPGVTRASAKAGRGVKAAARRVPGVERAAAGVRHAAADVNPAIVPEGMTRAQHEQVRQATRTARSSTSREVYKVQRRARAVQKAIGRDNYRLVLDAIEAGRIGSLPGPLQKPARFLRDQFRYARRVEKQAGIRGGTRKNYVPHVPVSTLEKGRGPGVEGVGARSVRPSSARARQRQGTLSQLRETHPGQYVEDPGVLLAARMSESAVARGKAQLNRRLADMGRTIRPGRGIELQPGEAVYHLRGSDIRELDLRNAADKRELQAVVDGRGRAGRYVALNSQAVNRALKTVTPGERSSIGAKVDWVQGKWKFWATQPNPGFHVRNLMGDLQNAYLAESVPRLARNLKQSGGALRELGRQERALMTVGRAVDPSGKGVKIGGKRVSYARLIAEAEQTGAIRSGFVSRELDDLIRAGKTPKPSRSHPVRRWLNNREDVVRLATYIGGRKRGLSPEEATARAMRFHFDYGDLSPLERRVLRRVMPFYTWSARDIPLQFKMLVTHPGKYAQYEKLRQEFAKAFGFEPGWEAELTEREQRSVPIPVVIDGKRLTLSLGPSGLPLTDLNEFPVSANPIKQADEWLERAASLVTPGIKTPVELWANVSFFFRDSIERDEGPLVPLSSLVADTIPERYRKQLGIVPDYVDRRTGKKGWGAPAKLVYALQVLPGPWSFLQRVTTHSDRAGQSAQAKTLGYFGLRAIPFDPLSTEIEELYDERAGVNKRMRAMNQRGINATNSTPEYQQLRAVERDLTSHIAALRTKRGDKILPGQVPVTSGPNRWEIDRAGVQGDDGGSWEIVRPEPSKGGSWEIVR